jgi:hypothetical protein
MTHNYELASGNQAEEQHYVMADAPNGQVEACDGRCEPAEHQREHDDVPGWLRAHPAGEIDPMEPAWRKPYAAMALTRFRISPDGVVPDTSCVRRLRAITASAVLGAP